MSVRTIQRLERGHDAGLESLQCIAATLEVNVSQQQDAEGSGCEQFPGANPVLPVVSIHETARFYEENLGFDVELLWEDPPYGVVARGLTIIEFGEGRKRHAGTGVCVIFVSDVVVIHCEYSDKAVEFVGDMAGRDYGSRDFRIKDNNGNMLIFSSPLINQQELMAQGNSVKNVQAYSTLHKEMLSASAPGYAA